MSEEPEALPADAADNTTAPLKSTAAESVGRGAGILARLAVRQALNSKTVREQVRDARHEAERPVEPPENP